jgi:hypothetical protein
MSEKINPCIVAKCGHFWGRKHWQSVIQTLNRPISEIGVPFFTELLLYGSKNRQSETEMAPVVIIPF